MTGSPTMRPGPMRNYISNSAGPTPVQHLPNHNRAIQALKITPQVRPLSPRCRSVTIHLAKGRPAYGEGRIPKSGDVLTPLRFHWGFNCQEPKGGASPAARRVTSLRFASATRIPSTSTGPILLWRNGSAPGYRAVHNTPTRRHPGRHLCGIAARGHLARTAASKTRCRRVHARQRVHPRAPDAGTRKLKKGDDSTHLPALCCYNFIRPGDVIVVQAR